MYWAGVSPREGRTVSDPLIVAIIGLVGAPLLALVYWLLRPRIWVRIKSSQPVTIAPGKATDVDVHVGRWRYSGDLELNIDGLPEWLSAVSKKISCGVQGGQITLTGKAGPLPKSTIVLQVVAGAASVHASAPLEVAFKEVPLPPPPPPRPRSLLAEVHAAGVPAGAVVNVFRHTPKVANFTREELEQYQSLHSDTTLDGVNHVVSAIGLVGDKEKALIVGLYRVEPGHEEGEFTLPFSSEKSQYRYRLVRMDAPALEGGMIEGWKAAIVWAQKLDAGKEMKVRLRRVPPWWVEWETLPPAVERPRPGSQAAKLFDALTATPTEYGKLWERAKFSKDPSLRTDPRKWAKAKWVARAIDADGTTELWSARTNGDI
jgi:hypothetical protein